MNSPARRRAWPAALGLGVALILADASIMSGQTDSDEMIFEAPTVVPNGAVHSVNNPPLPQTPPAKKMPVGKANLGQAGARTSPLKSPRTTIPGTQPNPTTLPNQAARLNQGTQSNLMSKPNPGIPLKPSTLPTQQAVPRQSSSNDKSTSSSVVTASATMGNSAVTTASHVDPLQGVTPDGGDPANPHPRRAKLGPPLVTTPMDRGAPPGVRGALLGLNGESATHRLLQMRDAAIELERENEELRQQNVGLMARVKEANEQLTTAVREIQLARKELVLARGDLDRLRNELQVLRDKVRIAEREYSAILQSMGPLLQQVLESDDVSALPPNPTE